MNGNEIRVINADISEKKLINEIAGLHVQTFEGFFLTFLGEGFLKQLYRGYCEFDNSGLIVAENENGQLIGFLAYSGDLNGLYKHLIKKRIIQFAWYSLCAFFRKPTSLLRLLKAFLKPGESKREEAYVELASIGVHPDSKGLGIGTMMIDKLKEQVDFSKIEYINLETDADNNEAANRFYLKSGFVLARTYETSEGRRMNEYRYMPDTK